MSDSIRWAVPLIACEVTQKPIAVHGYVDPATFGVDLHRFEIDCKYCGGIHEYTGADLFYDPADAVRLAGGGRPS